MQRFIPALLLALPLVFGCGANGPGASAAANLGTTAQSKACAHDRCAVGSKLTKSCDSCVTKVCSADSYCCATKWDAQCVGEVASVCGLSCSVCAPSCSQKQCGDDGCGGSCGSCPSGESCGAAGRCGTAAGGGTLLKFAVFGDARPPNLNETTGYPSTVVSGIFATAQSNGAQFVVGTGDYMFASTATAATAQTNLLVQAEKSFDGPIYLTMGNHECTGYTNSNCPNGNETPNVQAFMSTLLPKGTAHPYYRVDVPTPLGNAKFIFIAANAWSTAQDSWLKQQLADSTPYTFVVRHEPSTATTAPGVTPSDADLAGAQVTLVLLGHTHEYKHLDAQHVICGNGGAPLTASFSGSYGLLLIAQQANGNLSVTEIDEASGQATDGWSVTPSGAAAN